MATQCEGCGRQNPKTYDRGPFYGSPMELDYCRHCSENLCDNCMNNGRCESVTAPTDGTHEPADEDA